MRIHYSQSDKNLKCFETKKWIPMLFLEIVMMEY